MIGQRYTGIVALLAGMLLACQAGLATAQTKPELDPTLRPYDTNGAHKVEGRIVIGASESIRQLFDLWAERFRHFHPDVTFETTLIATSDAARAIFKGTAPIKEGADLVAVSFPLSAADLQAIEAQRGVRPIRVAVALDAIVLVVNHKNPLRGLTLSQVAEIFRASADQTASVGYWKQVGVEGSFGQLEINRYGRDDTSGTYMAFKEMALHGADQRADVRKEPGSMSVIIEVGSDERGIGYAATGYAIRSKRVRVVPLARHQGDRFTLPTNETVLNGDYPLVRELYIYAMPETTGQLKPAIKQFLAFVLSRDGQELAKEEGFFPLPASHGQQRLGQLERDGQVTRASTPERATN